MYDIFEDAILVVFFLINIFQMSFEVQKISGSGKPNIGLDEISIYEGICGKSI